MGTCRIGSPVLTGLLATLRPSSLTAPPTPAAAKLVQAAMYGAGRGSLAKCENRYTCPLNMDIITQLF